MSEVAPLYQTSTIDRIPTSELIDRYGKTKLYTQYFKALQIEPIRDGNNSYISPEQAKLVEGYHAVRGQGKAAVQAFLDELFAESPSVLERTGTVETVLERSDQSWLAFAEAIADRLSPPPSDPLLPQRQLQEIANRGWIVSSSQLQKILGVRAKEGERLGFTLMRSGRVGRSVGWRVEKVGD